jgi:hypothetical protein
LKRQQLNNSILRIFESDCEVSNSSLRTSNRYATLISGIRHWQYRNSNLESTLWTFQPVEIVALNSPQTSFNAAAIAGNALASDDQQRSLTRQMSPQLKD